MDFTVLIDTGLLDICDDNTIACLQNKRLLSIINDYEDGNWRQEKFDNFIWDNVAETALTYSERIALQNHPRSLLVAAAKNLRLTDANDDIGKGSELAEIVLYGIMRQHFSALPVVPKIFYKQNRQDNAKGADSVHIVVNNTNDFTLWFGEAKFYSNIEDVRLNTIVASVQHALDTDKLKKEKSIIVNLPELDHTQIDPNLIAAIKRSLDYNESIDSLKPRIVIPILLLHECKLTATANENTADQLVKLEDFHKARAISYFQKQSSALQATVFKYADVRFRLILFPVPEKKPIVDKFIASVEHYRR